MVNLKLQLLDVLHAFLEKRIRLVVFSNQVFVILVLMIKYFIIVTKITKNFSGYVEQRNVF
jgi:hypothetical protein